MRHEYYILDLTCDGDNTDHKTGEFPRRFVGKDGGDCRKKARDAAWKLGRLHIENDQDLCPRCSGKTPKPKPEDG